MLASCVSGQHLLGLDVSRTSHEYIDQLRLTNKVFAERIAVFT